jgi:hypothetical protein
MGLMMHRVDECGADNMLQALKTALCAYPNTFLLYGHRRISPL